jgi:hypothetical protein
MFPYLTDIFCIIDDFCQYLSSHAQKATKIETNTKGKKTRKKKCSMSLAEVMTIMVLFHLSHYRDFKTFYLHHVMRHMRSEFPKLVSYTRFVELMKISAIPLMLFMKGLSKQQTDNYFADSTPIKVCHIKREKSHKVFKGLAKKSKGTMGWFFGFKLHIVINHLGEIMNFTITTSTTDDRKPLAKLMEGLKGWLFADKGYIGEELIQKLRQQAIELFTKVKKNMKKRIMTPAQRQMLKKRGLVETVIDQLKNVCQIEHTRHRSPINALVNVFSGLVAYALKPRKPSISQKILPWPALLLMSN